MGAGDLNSAPQTCVDCIYSLSNLLSPRANSSQTPSLAVHYPAWDSGIDVEIKRRGTKGVEIKVKKEMGCRGEQRQY